MGRPITATPTLNIPLQSISPHNHPKSLLITPRNLPLISRTFEIKLSTSSCTPLTPAETPLVAAHHKLKTLMRTVKILLSELELDNTVPPKNRKFGRAKAVEEPQVSLKITPEKRKDESGDGVYSTGGDWLKGNGAGGDISIHISLDVGYGQEAVRKGMQQMKELEGLVKETVEKLSRSEPGSRFDNWRITYEHIQ